MLITLFFVFIIILKYLILLYMNYTVDYDNQIDDESQQLQQHIDARAMEIFNLCKDVNELNEALKLINSIIIEQGDDIETIETVMNRVENHALSAHKEIKVAETYMDTINKYKWYAGSALLVTTSPIIGIVAGIKFGIVTFGIGSALFYIK